MYSQVASRLTVKGDGTVAVSQAVSMESANEAEFEFAIYETHTSASPPDNEEDYPCS